MASITLRYTVDAVASGVGAGAIANPVPTFPFTFDEVVAQEGFAVEAPTQLVPLTSGDWTVTVRHRWSILEGGDGAVYFRDNDFYTNTTVDNPNSGPFHPLFRDQYAGIVPDGVYPAQGVWIEDSLEFTVDLETPPWFGRSVNYWAFMQGEAQQGRTVRFETEMVLTGGPLPPAVLGSAVLRAPFRAASAMPIQNPLTGQASEAGMDFLG